MPRDINDTFTTEKNRQENTPIWCYHIYVPEATDIYLTEWDTDIVYPTVGGHTYLKFPLKHEGISKNILGETDSVKVTMSNVDRSIGAILLSKGGLVDYKVDITLVFENLLDDADANITETFWIETSNISETVSVFILTTRLDLYQLKLPGRVQHRDCCGWTFKKEGCYLTTSPGVYAAPAGFLNAGVECDHTVNGSTGCVYHANSGRFGSYPGIPHRAFFIV